MSRASKPLPTLACLRALLLALATVGALAAVPAPASAQGAAPGGRSEVSLAFGSGTARLVGSHALVRVRCTGPREGLCNGTVTLSVRGKKHEVPVSLGGGSVKSLAVPVGPGRHLSGRSAVAVARTVEPLGGYRHSARRLHLR